MISAPPPSLGYAIPATMLPALADKYGGPCEGVDPPVRMRNGGRGYRSVVCNELRSPPLLLTINPTTGRIRVAVRPA